MGNYTIKNLKLAVVVNRGKTMGKYIYKPSPENLSKLFAIFSLVSNDDVINSEERLEMVIEASISIVNDTTGKYSVQEQKSAQNMVKFAMAGNLITRVGGESKTVLRTTPRL